MAPCAQPNGLVLDACMGLQACEICTESSNRAQPSARTLFRWVRLTSTLLRWAIGNVGWSCDGRLSPPIRLGPYPNLTSLLRRFPCTPHTRSAAEISGDTQAPLAHVCSLCSLAGVLNVLHGCSFSSRCSAHACTRFPSILLQLPIIGRPF